MMNTGSDPDLDNLRRRRALLSHASLLQGCPALELDGLARHAQIQICRAETLLVAQDAPAEAIYFIAYGRVRLSLIGDSGRELTVGELGRGDCFGETAILGDSLHVICAVATEEVMLLVIPRHAFVAHVQVHPPTAVKLALELARRLSASNLKLADVGIYDVESRIVRTLRRLAAQDGETTDAGVLIRRRLTHQELAHMVGICRETVTRNLAAMTRRGLLASRNGHIILKPPVLDVPGVQSSRQT